VKCLHPRYIGIYFCMSYEYSFMGFIFFKCQKIAKLTFTSQRLYNNVSLLASGYCFT